MLDAYTEPEIIAWKFRVGKAKAAKVSEEALRFGTIIDQLIQEDIKKGFLVRQIGLEPSVDNAIAGWQKFKAEHPEYVGGVEQIQAELVSGSLVGHPDIVHIKEISDIKSSRTLTIRPKWVVQASKYAVMKERDRAAIILLSKETPTYMYVWWDGPVLEYFGKTVFGAYETILDSQEVTREMVRNYMEKESLGAL